MSSIEFKRIDGTNSTMEKRIVDAEIVLVPYYSNYGLTFQAKSENVYSDWFRAF